MKNVNEENEWGPFVGDLSGCYWQEDAFYLKSYDEEICCPPIENEEE